MLDYKDIIIKHYGLGLSGREITKHLCISKSGANKFLTACKECRTLNFPLTDGITNYAIANHVCGDSQPSHARDEEFTSPNFENIHKQMQTRKKITSPTYGTATFRILHHYFGPRFCLHPMVVSYARRQKQWARSPIALDLLKQGNVERILELLHFSRRLIS